MLWRCVGNDHEYWDFGMVLYKGKQLTPRPISNRSLNAQVRYLFFQLQESTVGFQTTLDLRLSFVYVRNRCRPHKYLVTQIWGCTRMHAELDIQNVCLHLIPGVAQTEFVLSLPSLLAVILTIRFLLLRSYNRVPFIKP